MKKIIGIFATVAFMAFAIVSCEDPENTTDGYIEGLFTIHGHHVIPETSDTMYYVNNMNEFGLKTGERGIMRIKYEYDSFMGPLTAKWEIGKVYSLIPTRTLTAASEIDEAEMDSYFADVYNFVAYNNYGYAWVWKNIQNINVIYYTDGSKEPDFRMSADGFANDTLKLHLWAGNITDGDNKIGELLSFDISNAASMLDEAERSQLVLPDTIYTTITADFGVDKNEIERATIYTGKCANPYK